MMNSGISRKPITPVLNTLLSSAEPLTEEERAEFERKERTRQRNRLRAWVRDGLAVAAIDDDEIAKSIIHLAGLLCRSRKELASLLKQEMKPDKLWDTHHLIMAWITYAYFLEEEGGKQKKARQRLISHEEKRVGGKISDGRMATLLSNAATTIPITSFPEHIRGVIEKRRERGRKTNRRGIGVITNEKPTRKR